jgi:hypothetical protein
MNLEAHIWKMYFAVFMFGIIGLAYDSSRYISEFKFAYGGHAIAITHGCGGISMNYIGAPAIKSFKFERYKIVDVSGSAITRRTINPDIRYSHMFVVLAGLAIAFVIAGRIKSRIERGSHS